MHGDEGAMRCKGRRLVRRALNAKMSPTGEGADRSGGHCTVIRAATDLENAVREEGADKAAGRCMVGRAPTCQEGAVW